MTRRYPAYRDSGVEWLREVPEGWQAPELKRFASLTYGDALASEIRDDDGEVPVYGSNGPVGTHSVANGFGPVILVGRKGSYGALNWCDSDCFAIDTVYLIDRRFTNCDLRWLFWALHLARFEGSSQDTGVPGLSRGVAHQTRFPLPPLPEQTAIAAFLDRETAKLDALVAEQRRLINLLREKRQAIISHAVTKGLNPDARMKPSSIDSLGDVPESWAVVPLKFLTAPGRDIMYGIVLPGPDVEEGVPIVKGGDVKPHRLKLELLNRTTTEIEAPFARARLRPRDIVYSIRGTIGDAEHVPPELEDANITQDVARVSPSSEVDSDWLLFVLRSKTIFAQLEPRSLGAAVRGINIFDLKRARIPVPTPAEQAAIASYLLGRVEGFDALTATAETAIALLQERRAALISAAVTGKIDVRHLSPAATEAA